MAKRLVIASSLVAMGAPGGVAAQTLHDTLTATLRDNPQIAAEQARVRAAEADLDAARAERSPLIVIDASARERVVDTFGVAQTAPWNTGANGDVAIWAGDRVTSRIRAAAARLTQQRATFDLRADTVTAQAAIAHADVIRNRAAERLAQAQVNILATFQQATDARYRGGDLTLTDVHQVEARIALARGRHSTAQAQLVQAEETYRQLTAIAPGRLADLERPVLAIRSDQLIDLIEASPTFAVAAAQTAAARADVRVARSEFNPRLQLTSRFDYGRQSDRFGLIEGRASPVFRIGLTLTVPIHQAGGPAARLRQAYSTYEATRENQTRVERDMVAEIRSQYAALLAGDAQVEATRTAVAANEEALKGVRTENSIGARTILEVLNAEQELYQAQLDLATAHRNRLAVAYQLLAMIGRIRPELVRDDRQLSRNETPTAGRVAAPLVFDRLGLWQWPGSTHWFLPHAQHANPSIA